MTILTHIRPHIDDVCGLWLLAKHDPACAGADFAFVPSAEAPAWLAAHPGAVAVGVGRGKFDEHKGDRGDCAATLVFASVKARIADPLELRATERIVQWVFEGDTGQRMADRDAAFSLAAIFRGVYDNAGKDSEALRAFGFTCLDALLVSMKNAIQVEDDWAGRIEFDSRFGKGAAFVSSAEGAESYPYQFGIPLALLVNKERTYFTIRADARSSIDLTPVAEALKEKDPDADWFFHHSGRMLICGGYLAPQARLSRLTLEEMVKLVQ